MQVKVQKDENLTVFEFEETEPMEERINDFGNIALLFYLYILQGIPLGLIAAVPIILQNRHVSFTDQAGYSFVVWPFSLKILWAPLIDIIYCKRFGRRKSWLIPTQYSIGLYMLFISTNVEEWLGDEEGKEPPKMMLLTIVLFVCIFLAAIQDVVVDGWALTMLHRKNVGFSSICNSVGQTTGFFFGYVGIMVFESADFCNKWLRSTPQLTGIISFASYIRFWSIVFLLSTTLIAIFKKDNSLSVIENEKDIDMTVKQSYLLLLKIIKLKPVREVAKIMLTYKIGFAGCEALTSLKLVQAGVHRDKIALMGVPMMLLEFLLAFLLRRHMTGPKPMNVFLVMTPYRIFFNFLFAALVYLTPVLISENIFTGSYYILLAIAFGLLRVTVYCMFLSTSAFYAKISDQRFGSTYMTLLNALDNFGSFWPQTFMLWLVDWLEFRRCRTICEDVDKEPCTSETICEVFIDGYYIEVVVGTLIGICWMWWSRPRIKQLQNFEDSMWLVDTST